MVTAKLKGGKNLPPVVKWKYTTTMLLLSSNIKMFASTVLRRK